MRAEGRAQPRRAGDLQGLVDAFRPLRRHPRRSASRQLHGFPGGRRRDGINLLDYGCIRIFPPLFVGGVVDLYRGLLQAGRDQVADAYEIWGFRGLTGELIEILNIWARFIYGPLLDDRVRTIADGVSPGAYGRGEAAASATQAARKGAGDRSARIRFHGPRRDRPRRRLSCISARGSISTACSRRRWQHFDLDVWRRARRRRWRRRASIRPTGA